MYVFAAGLFVASFFLIGLNVPLISIGLFGIGTLLATVGLAKRFWTQTRIRLIELLFMTSLSGGVLGFSIQWLLAYSRFRKEELVLVIVILVCSVAIWILGGVSNAIIVADRIGSNGTFERFGLIVLYLLFPLVVVFTPILILFICVQRDSDWQLNLCESIATSIAAVWFCNRAWKLRAAAKRAGLRRPVVEPVKIQ